MHLAHCARAQAPHPRRKCLQGSEFFISTISIWPMFSRMAQHGQLMNLSWPHLQWTAWPQILSFCISLYFHTQSISLDLSIVIFSTWLILWVGICQPSSQVSYTVGDMLWCTSFPMPSVNSDLAVPHRNSCEWGISVSCTSHVWCHVLTTCLASSMDRAAAGTRVFDGYPGNKLPG